MGFSRALRTAFDFFLKQNSKGDEGPICEICLMALKKPKGVPVAAASACVHLFHPQCLQAWLEIRITEGNIKTIACPSCPTLLTQADVFRLVSPALQAKYLKFKRSAELSANPNVRWCPSPGCETPILGKSHPRLAQTATAALAKTVVVGSAGAVLAGLAGHSSLGVWTATGACAVAWLVSVTRKHGKFYWLGLPKSECPKCCKAICFDCSLPFHPDKHCKQTDVALLKNWADGKDTCHCPSCHSLIEKREGCNHMTCRCGCQFCWLCREIYSPTHFSEGGCKQFGAERARVAPSKVSWMKKALIAFVACVTLLRLLLLPLLHFLFFYFHPPSSSTLRHDICPVPDPFTVAPTFTPLPDSFTVNWTAAVQSLGAHLGFELCIYILSDRGQVYRRGPNPLRRWFWLFIPAVAAVRFLFTCPRSVVGVASFASTVAVLGSRRPFPILLRLLLVSLIVLVNCFESSVWLLVWLGEFGLSLTCGLLITLGACVAYLMSLAGDIDDAASLFIQNCFGGVGPYLAMSSALSLFFCLHFLGLSHWSLRLGLCCPMVCAWVVCVVVSRREGWGLRRRAAALTQAAVGVVCFGSVLLLVSDPVRVQSVAQAVAPVVSLSVWGLLRLPFDVLAITALPLIANLD